MSFESILRCHQRINGLSRSLLGRRAFDELHVALPDPASPEPGFIRATSWLYCLYFEAGRVSLTFLRRLGEVHSLIDRAEIDEHVEVVRCLRTELHHNLGFVDSDQAARAAAEGWRRRVCGTAIPRDNKQWSKCYVGLLKEANRFLSAIDEVVRRIEADGDKAGQHREEWLRRLDRSWPAAAFDPVIDEAKHHLGRQALNTVEFRQRHVDRWRAQLDLMEDGFNFAEEATRLVEKSLLDGDSFVLPITGRDIVNALKIKSGPRIGTLLEQARRRFAAQPCTREELLAHLERSRSDSDFDSLVEAAKVRFGRDDLNTIRFRQCYVDHWREQLDLMEDDVDFDYHATRLIEKALTEDVLLPITSQDVLDSLQIKPGRRVGALLVAARKRFESEPCTKEALLEYLAAVP
ncbi:MAG: hypothetical protein IPK80_27220 [Nannocystis sp.]|nr:hypothetical protein [Nannocystis sp.]